MVSAGVKQLFLNPAVQYISHQTWLALWEIVSAYPVSINMPGCHFNDSWLEEVKYKIWLLCSYCVAQHELHNAAIVLKVSIELLFSYVQLCEYL